MLPWRLDGGFPPADSLITPIRSLWALLKGEPTVSVSLFNACRQVGQPQRSVYSILEGFHLNSNLNFIAHRRREGGQAELAAFDGRAGVCPA